MPLGWRRRSLSLSKTPPQPTGTAAGGLHQSATLLELPLKEGPLILCLRQDGRGPLLVALRRLLLCPRLFLQTSGVLLLSPTAFLKLCYPPPWPSQLLWELA